MADTSDRLPHVLFALLLVLCVLFGLTFVIEEQPFDEIATDAGGVERVYLGHGTTHDQYASMDHGGDGPARHGPVLWMAWTFAVVQLGIIIGSLLLGVRHPDRIRFPLVMSGVTLAGLLTLMTVTYVRYLDDPTASLFLGLPAPTAWFLYAFWPTQFLVVVLFVLFFSRGVVTPADMERFRQIVDERRARVGRG